MMKLNQNILKTFIFLSLFVAGYSSQSLAINLSVKVGDRLVQAKVYEGQDKDLLIWIPSEYGNQGSYHTIAKKISQFGVEVWYIDLFSANYLSPSANILSQIPATQVSALISQAIKHSSKRVWLMSSEKGAQLALAGLHDWHGKNSTKNTQFGGAILLNPDLTYGSPPVGQYPDYLPIVSVINKPVSVLQPRLSKNYYYLSELVDVLKKGGSSVSTMTIDGVRDRFHFRKYTEEIEDQVRNKRLPSLIVRELRRLETLLKDTKASSKIPKRLALPNVDLPLNITPVLKPEKLINFSLTDVKGITWTNNDMEGKVVLATFWPYWCASCRFQAKAMQSLYDKVKGSTFNLLSVYFDDDSLKIKKLIKRYKVTYLMLKGNINLIKELNFRDFPSTLIIDKKGYIRYAMYGVMKQSNTDKFVEIINKLKKEH